MSINHMNPLDLNLKLLAGEGFYVDGFKVEPRTLRDIVKVGYTTYNQLLGIVTAKVEDLIGKENMHELPEGLTTFDLILKSRSEQLISTFVNGLAFFLGEDDYQYSEKLGLVFGDPYKEKIVNNNNFDELVEVLRYQNCVKEHKEEDKYNPSGDKAKSIIEKLKKAKELVKKAKQKDGEGQNIDFYSIISAVSTKSNNISKLNIWDLNIYQLYDEYRRLEMIVGYETSVLAMVNGADIKNLKHWSANSED